jgi:uncharacterized membrane protein
MNAQVIVERFQAVAEMLALSVEAGAALLVAIGALQAFFRVGCLLVLRHRSEPSEKRAIWLGFAAWLLLGLEFELAADIIRSAISPSWSQLGQLALVAAIRTFLSYFLSRDIAESDKLQFGTPHRPPDAEPESTVSH